MLLPINRKLNPVYLPAAPPIVRGLEVKEFYFIIIKSTHMAIVYSLKNPMTQLIYYVGFTTKSISERLIGHLGTPKQKTTIDLKEAGLTPIIEIIEEGENVTKITEMYWIQKYNSEGLRLENTSGIERCKNVNNSGLSASDLVIFESLNGIDRLRFGLEKIKDELPLSSSIPIVIRIKNIVEYSLVTTENQ